MNKTNILLLIFIMSYFTVNVLAQETGSKSGHTGPVTSVVFTPDGKQIVSGSFKEKTIRIWDVATGREIRNIISDINGVDGLRLIPDGKQIISSSFNLPGIIRIWDKDTGKELRTISDFAYQPILSMDLSPDGKQIAAIYDEFYEDENDISRIVFYNADTGRQIRTIFTEGAGSITFSPDEKQIATCHPDNKKIKIWDLVTGQEILTISEDVIWLNFLTFTPDGKYIISKAYSKQTHDPVITIWDANTGKKNTIISEKPEQFSPIAISPDGNLMAIVLYREKLISLFDIATGEKINTISNFSGHTDKISSLAFSPDGKMLVSGSADKSIKLWDVATGKEIRTMGK